MHFPFLRPLLLALLAGPATAAQADESGDANFWRLVASPYTHHFRYNAEHRPVRALGIERQHTNGWLGGFTYFSNSFGQPSGFLYLGHRYERLLGVEPLFAQWSAGVLYGYKGRFQTKVPLNFNGYSPGVLVTAGWKLTDRNSVALHLLGDAAVMLQLAHEFR